MSIGVRSSARECRVARADRHFGAHRRGCSGVRSVDREERDRPRSFRNHDHRAGFNPRLVWVRRSEPATLGSRPPGSRFEPPQHERREPSLNRRGRHKCRRGV